MFRNFVISIGILLKCAVMSSGEKWFQMTGGLLFFSILVTFVFPNFLESRP